MRRSMSIFTVAFLAVLSFAALLLHPISGVAAFVAIEVDGQHIADGSAEVATIVKALHAAEHQESATALGDEFLQQQRDSAGKT